MKLTLYLARAQLVLKKFLKTFVSLITINEVKQMLSSASTWMEDGSRVQSEYYYLPEGTYGGCLINRCPIPGMVDVDPITVNTGGSPLPY